MARQRAEARKAWAGSGETARILLNSKSNRFPNGLANGSGLVGKYIMDTVGASLGGQIPALENLPLHNEDGAGGAHAYVPWWLYREQLAGKLDGQDAGEVHRGRKLSDSGAKARLFHEVAEAHLSKIIKVDLQSDLFTYNIDEQALRQAELLDGKLLLVTNVTALSPQAIVQRYKSLADIERGFRVLKSEIELASVYHRLPPWRQNTHWLSSNGFIAIGSKSMTESCMASPP